MLTRPGQHETGVCVCVCFGRTQTLFILQITRAGLHCCPSLIAPWCFPCFAPTVLCHLRTLLSPSQLAAVWMSSPCKSRLQTFFFFFFFFWKQDARWEIHPRLRVINCARTIHCWTISLSREVCNSSINLLLMICSLLEGKEGWLLCCKNLGHDWSDVTLANLKPSAPGSAFTVKSHTLCPLLFHSCSFALALALAL